VYSRVLKVLPESWFFIGILIGPCTQNFGNFRQPPNKSFLIQDRSSIFSFYEGIKGGRKGEWDGPSQNYSKILNILTQIEDCNLIEQPL
jgi:hypothetical protein